MKVTASLRHMPTCFGLVAFLLALPAWGDEVQSKGKPLFDGKTFAGWEGDTKETWRIEDGSLVGGTLTRKQPRNEFLSTTKEYADFVLTVKFKLLGDAKKGFV